MKYCFGPVRILLPAEEISLEKWACLACDQFTSQPDYWQRADRAVGDAPSTLRMILPEVYLGAPDEPQRIEAVHAAMRDYRARVLTRTVEGFVYLERRTQSGLRQGLVGAVDLEAYSYTPQAESPVRPTEQTVPERIPPRLAVRRGAVLESPHVMLLMDDQAAPVLEPLAGRKAEMRRVYGGPLMLGGGGIEGWAIEDPAMTGALEEAVAALGSQQAFDARWPSRKGHTPLTLAVGDGNHSLATAKAYWEELKRGLTPAQQEDHPARYCLVELCSLYSPALCIEPIHRVLFPAEGRMVRKDLIWELAEYAENNGTRLRTYKRAAECVQRLTLLCGEEKSPMGFAEPVRPLVVDAIDGFVQRYIGKHPGTRVDYVHGEEACRALVEQGAAAFLLPPMTRQEIVAGVVLDGVLPRKSFSMGHAEEKRYYLECRSLT